ncbi:MAG: hypothetical protein K8823_242 [Cenarchaeum symbiont of Oopsacas minuta]|nr:hypothetical protein [Cenarchaeum symbiont of Oopsacas minuta]
MNMDILCKIQVDCPIYPSEDQEKIRIAFTKILLETETKIKGNKVSAIFENTECLEKIRTVIESKKNQNAYRKRLIHNANRNSSWFLLNKQAAYAGKVALCDEEDDSPLGAIKITIECSDLERIVDWLTPFA